MMESRHICLREFHCVQSVEYVKPRAVMGNTGKRVTVAKVCMKHSSWFCRKISFCVSLLPDFSVVYFLVDQTG